MRKVPARRAGRAHGQPTAKPFPPLRFHAPTKQHYVWDRDKRDRLTLGRDFAEALPRYERLKADYQSRAVSTLTPQPIIAPPTAGISVAELLDAYVRHCRRDGFDAKAMHKVETAARMTAERYGLEPATTFRVPQLRDLRERMLATDSRRCAKPEGKRKSPRRITPRTTEPVKLAREYVNRLVTIVRAAWTWAAGEDMIPAESAMVLRMLKPIRKGKKGREVDRITDVDEEVVAATMPQLSPTHAAMVSCQQVAGMRPGEVCGLRRRDISTWSGEMVRLPETSKLVSAYHDEGSGVLIWVAVPESHKTLWRGGKPRIVALGPKAQAILEPFMAGLEPDEYLFSPRKASAAWRRERNREEVYGEGRMPGECYTSESYGQAVGRAVERVNRKRERDIEVGPAQPPIPHWRPNQLRHSAGTEIAGEFDRTHAAAALGNSMGIIDVYIEHDLKKAGKVAARMG